jgi:hypothetical protein
MSLGGPVPPFLRAANYRYRFTVTTEGKHENLNEAIPTRFKDTEHQEGA